MCDKIFIAAINVHTITIAQNNITTGKKTTMIKKQKHKQPNKPNLHFSKHDYFFLKMENKTKKKRKEKKKGIKQKRKKETGR